MKVSLHGYSSGTYAFGRIPTRCTGFSPGFNSTNRVVYLIIIHNLDIITVIDTELYLWLAYTPTYGRYRSIGWGRLVKSLTQGCHISILSDIFRQTDRPTSVAVVLQIRPINNRRFMGLREGIWLSDYGNLYTLFILTVSEYSEHLKRKNYRPYNSSRFDSLSELSTNNMLQKEWYCCHRTPFHEIEASAILLIDLLSLKSNWTKAYL